MNWLRRFIRRSAEAPIAQASRLHAIEQLEPRCLMAGDVTPVKVGLVYIESDAGSDSAPDRFLLNFTGGAPGTELREIVINLDKDNDGYSTGDLIFDTAVGGRGKGGVFDFAMRSFNATGSNATWQATVADGGMLLTLRLSGFLAGDTLEFTIDVDEIVRNAPDLATFNQKLDELASGQEFEDSMLEVVFTAPHYHDVIVRGNDSERFLNDYGDPAVQHGLKLPPDIERDANGNKLPGNAENRNAAAVLQRVQQPLPIEINGTVWVDNNRNLIREAQETLLPNVEVALFKLDPATNQYNDTGLRRLTNANGAYQFGKDLGLLPGTYRVVQTQPAGYFSVGAVPGKVNGTTIGTAPNVNMLESIQILLGDSVASNYDFAEAQPAQISGYVYRDDNDDGVRDPNEVGLRDVTIRLVPVNTITTQSALTVTTDANGFYQFTGLAPGEYRVEEVTQPPGLFDGRDTAGTVSGVRIGTAENDRIINVMLNGNSRGIEYNFGELPPGSLSGFVYLTAPGKDCDGTLDADDLPLAQVQIQLLATDGSLVAETRTNAAGFYQFTNLPKGTYTIVETTPAGLLEGDAHVGKIGTVTIGAATNGSRISQIVMPAGGVGTHYDFCEAAPASIAGNVYHDASNDGVRNANEAGIAQTVIRLVDTNGQVVQQTTTDAQGRYAFANVLPGVYQLIETQPTGYLDGLDTPGTIRGSTRGSAVNPGDRIVQIELKQGDVGIEFNFGELLPASLSGRVHADLDDDCLWDPGELLLSGVEIRLLNEAGQEVARTLTNAEGRYEFKNLAPGRYSVIETQPAGYFNGGTLAGSVGGDTSIPDQIRNIQLTAGTNAIDYNFCEKPPSELSGWVFADQDADCIRDAGERGIENVQVDLLDATGQVIATTRTDASGQYRFTNLPKGSYSVVEHQPAGFLQGGQRAGSHGGDDSLVDRIRQIPVGWGETLIDYNFCELLPSSISGNVYVDRDADCIRDPNERPLSGVRIDLIDASGNVVASTLTDDAGNYSFKALPPGTYQVREHQPAGYFQGGQVVGSGGGRVLADDLLGEIILTPGVDLISYDFCEVEPGSISGNVYVDRDADCIRDPDELPLEGVRIELLDALGQTVATTTTDAQGQYSFTNLRPGEYQVIEFQPVGYYQGGQVVGSGGGEVIGADHLGKIQLLPGANLVDYDFCELPGGSLSGRVWVETDLNGRFNPGETPLGQILIELLNANGTVVRTTSTATDGTYQFDNLEPGTYQVRETQPLNLFHGGQRIGSHGGDQTIQDLLRGINVPAGVSVTEYNFFEVPPASISGYVFQDGPAILSAGTIDPTDLRNYRDGQRTPDDLPLPGVTLELRSTNGEPIPSDRALAGHYSGPTIRVTTDAAGFYQFTGLRPGRYHVYQVQPTGYLDGLDTPGSLGGHAINPADQPANDEVRVLITTLAFTEATNPKNDAILSIDLAAGTAAFNNNFSEVVVEPAIPPRTPDPKPPEPPVEIRDTFAYADPLLAMPVLPNVRKDPLFDLIRRRVTWHLSVINAGYPRGMRGTADAQEAVFQPTAGRLDSEEWMRDRKDRGRWHLLRGDGLPLDFSDQLKLGTSQAIPIAGDFNGDGISELGIYVAGNWFIDLNGNGIWDTEDMWIFLGTDMDLPVVGDWDGDGKDDVGIFGPEWSHDVEAIIKEPGLPDPENTRRFAPKNVPPTAPEATDGGRLLRRTPQGPLRADLIDHVFRYGNAEDTPLSGDWNGDGIDTIAIFRGGQWILDVDGDGRFTQRDEVYDFGQAGDIPIVGDWDGNGIDDLGVRRDGLWILDSDGNRILDTTDQQLPQSTPPGGDTQPVAGDWDGDGKDEPGLYESTETDKKAA